MIVCSSTPVVGASSNIIAHYAYALPGTVLVATPANLATSVVTTTTAYNLSAFTQETCSYEQAGVQQAKPPLAI